KHVGGLVFSPEAAVQRLHLGARSQQHVDQPLQSRGAARARHEAGERQFGQIRDALLKDDQVPLSPHAQPLKGASASETCGIAEAVPRYEAGMAKAKRRVAARLPPVWRGDTPSRPFNLAPTFAAQRGRATPASQLRRRGSSGGDNGATGLGSSSDNCCSASLVLWSS